MTNPTPTEKDVAEVAAVTQADREAANRAVRLAKNRLAKMAGLDSLDPVFFYKAFARHRIEAVRNHLISTPNMPKGERADG
jgi:hypothetical protein